MCHLQPSLSTREGGYFLQVFHEQIVVCHLQPSLSTREGGNFLIYWSAITKYLRELGLGENDASLVCVGNELAASNPNANMHK